MLQCLCQFYFPYWLAFCREFMSGIEFFERVIKHIQNRVAFGIKLQNAYSGAFSIRDIYQLPLRKFLLLSDISKFRCYALNELIKASPNPPTTSCEKPRSKHLVVITTKTIEVNRYHCHFQKYEKYTQT